MAGLTEGERFKFVLFCVGKYCKADEDHLKGQDRCLCIDDFATAVDTIIAATSNTTTATQTTTTAQTTQPVTRTGAQQIIPWNMYIIYNITNIKCCVYNDNEFLKQLI